MNRFIMGAVCLTLIAHAAVAAPPDVPPAAPDTIYRTLLLRAAPGSFDALLDLYRGRREVLAAAGLERPVLMRHSQGDQWDVFTVGFYDDMQHFAADPDCPGRSWSGPRWMQVSNPVRRSVRICVS